MKLGFIVLLFMFFSLATWADEHDKYERGYRVCSDRSEWDYKQDSEDIYTQYAYAACLVIKGQDALGLNMLYQLSDHKSDIPSSFFIADYLSRDGQFNLRLTQTKIDEALKYYFRTLALVDLYQYYPGLEYAGYDYSHQVELRSFFDITNLLLEKYKIGVMNETCEKALQYGYEDECPTHQGYGSTTWDSLNQMLKYARDCANLREKRHFDKEYYQVVIKSCSLLEDLALTLHPLEEKRKQLLLREDCKDIVNCEDYMAIYGEFRDLYYRLYTNYSGF